MTSKNHKWGMTIVGVSRPKRKPKKSHRKYVALKRKQNEPVHTS